MNKTRTFLISGVAIACLAASADAFASPEFGRGLPPQNEPVVSMNMLQVSPRHPNRMVGGQGMPALGRPYTTVTPNVSALHDLHPGYEGFVSDGD